MKKRNSLFDGFHPAVICVWAAVQATANMLPAVVLLGVGGTMTVANCIIPLGGVFFGPYAGALCASIGQIVGLMIQPSGAWLGAFTWVLGTCTAFTAGMISRGKWPVAYALNALGIAIFYCFPVGREAWIKGVTFGIGGVITCLIGGIFAKKFITHRNVILKGISIWCCCAGGLLTTCMFADEANIILSHPPAITMKMMAFISPTERFVFALGSVIIGLPLLYGLPKIGIFVGPQRPEDLIDEDPADPSESPALEAAAQK